MTERWGKCRVCKGQGSVRRQVTKEVAPKDSQEQDAATSVIIEEECGACFGEGYDGRAENCPW